VSHHRSDTIADEVADVTKTLIWIATAYLEGQTYVAGLDKADGDARPRIVARFRKSNEYRAADDIACVRWILTPLQEGVNEGDLPGWRKLRKVSGTFLPGEFGPASRVAAAMLTLLRRPFFRQKA